MSYKSNYTGEQIDKVIGDNLEVNIKDLKRELDDAKDVVVYQMPSDFIPQNGEEVSKEITTDVFQSIFGNIDEFINNVKTKHIRLGIPYFIEDMDVPYTAVFYIDVTSSISIKISPTGEETVYNIGISGRFSLGDVPTVVWLVILCNSTDMMGSWTAKKETTPAELEAKINNILVDFGTVGIGNVYRTIWKWGQTHHAGNHIKPLTLRIESQFRGNPSHLETFVGTAQWIYGEGRKGAYHLIGSLSGDSEDGSKLVEVLVDESGIVECKNVSTSIIYNWDDLDLSASEGTVSQEVYDNLLKADVVTNNGSVFTDKWVDDTSITLAMRGFVDGGEEQVACDLFNVTVKEDLTYTVKYYGYNLPSEDLVDEKLRTKQDKLVSGENIKTINNQSILGEGNITIEGGSGVADVGITGTLNVTDPISIAAAQDLITKPYGVAFYLITDSNGKLPSKNQEAVNISAGAEKLLSFRSPNPTVNNILDQVSMDNFKPRGVNVGDIIALSRVPVGIDALVEYLGLSSAIATALKLLGLSEIEIYQYKIWTTNDAKWSNFRNKDGSVVPTGVKGLMSVWDKEQVDKVPRLEANDLSTKYGYGTNFDDCLTTGVCAYSPATIGGVTENFTLVVQRSSTVDSGGFYTIIQSAYGRTGEVYNRIFQRMIFHNPSNGTIERHDWVEISTSAYVDKAIYSVLNTEV